MPKDSNQKATPLSGFDFLKKLGIGRVKRVDPSIPTSSRAEGAGHRQCLRRQTR